MGRTLYEKIYEEHLIDPENTESPLIYVDGHLVFEVTSPQAFEGLKNAGRRVRRVDLTLATVDHNVPTEDRSSYRDAESFIKQPDSRNQVMTLEKNVKSCGISYFGMADRRQGIVHVMGPEEGFTLPGMVLVCGDSHTPTHGAFGALAIGIGTSEVEHVLATQTLLQKKATNMRVRVEGELLQGVYSKDIILHLIGQIGTAGATGCVIEFCGSTIESLSMEARMVVCNMTCEAGARAGLIAPDEKTFAYLKGKPLAPRGDAWETALKSWQALYSDSNASYDIEIELNAKDIAPTITWGVTPSEVVSIMGKIPDPADYDKSDPVKARNFRHALEYQGLEPNMPITSIKLDRVFIGSCTNSRIEDIRLAAKVLYGRRVAPHVSAMIVPGSGLVRHQAEKEGLDKVFKDAGFDWREAGCSMCLGMNPDILSPGQRCASTSNRNYEGRQGVGGRTHLCSPAMAAAAAVKGYFADVRDYLDDEHSKLFEERIVIENVDSGKEDIAEPLEDTDRSDMRQDILPKSISQTHGTGLPKFEIVKGIAAPLAIPDVNTGLLITSKFLKTVKRTGLGKALFYDIRYDSVTGKELPTFVLNQEPYRHAQILVNNGPNFGCGSSREHAVWGFVDFGIRCIIAPSFADLYANNCLKNGILPISIADADVMNKIHAEASAKRQIEIDLPNQKVRTENGDELASFDIDHYRKHCLVNGLDDIGITLQQENKISAFEKEQITRYPWLFGRVGSRIVPSVKNVGIYASKKLDLAW